MGARTTGLIMIFAAIATNAVFLALTSVFGYPDVLRQEPATILGEFRAHQTAVVALFAALAALSALLIPIAISLRGFEPDPTAGHIAAVIGVLAGVVQAVGLLRWVYAVPPLADAAQDPATEPAATVMFSTLHQYLGVGIGEALGYVATSLWTVLVAVGVLHRLGQPAWLRWIGIVASVAIAAGIVEPLGAEAAGPVNFGGYVVWSLWLLATGALLVARPPAAVAGRPGVGGVAVGPAPEA